jgi:DNA-binding transcriptional LysR family regulator
MDRLQAMTVFAKVVEQGSFARAADRLSISTSACSRQVAELEAHLGSRLLNRTTRRLSLTESGQGFYERCVQLLADLEDAERAAGESAARPRGTIRLATSINFGVRHVSPALGEFLAAYPEVKFDVSLSDRIVDLVEEGYDLAIRIGSAGGESVVARKLGEARLVACASPAYLKAHGTPKTPEDLARHSCVTYEYSPARHVWSFFGRDGREHAVRVSGPLHANNGDLLAAAAVAGVGIVYEPEFIVGPDIRAGRLVPILKAYTAPLGPIYAVYPSRRYLTAKVRAFVEFLAQRFAGTRWS